MKKLIFILSFLMVGLMVHGQLDTLKLVGGGFAGGDSRKVAYQKINDAIIAVNTGFDMAATTAEDAAYYDMINSEWTQEDTITNGGTNGIYSIINPIYNITNAYGLRARLDLRDATADTVHVNQLHAIDGLINLNETKDYGVIDNISAIGVAIHGGASGADVVDEDPNAPYTGSLNLYYGVWGPTAEQNLDAETNGMVLVTHAATHVDYGFQFRNSGTSTAGIYIQNHSSNSPATMTSGILMESASGKMTYGVNMTGAGITSADILFQEGATIDNVDADTLDLTETVVQITGKFYLRGGEQHADFAITDKQVPLLEYWSKTKELNKLPAMEFRDRADVMDYIGGLEEAAERNLRYILELEARLTALESE